MSVLMPAYNEEENLESAVYETLNVMKSLNVDFEVIIINDGSTDNTEDVARTLCDIYENVHLISYYPNKGKGYALKTGFSKSRGDVVVFIDADLDIHPSQIKSLLDAIERGYDVVIGSKFVKGANVKVSIKRRLFSIAYRTITRALIGLNVSDTQVGLKAFRREVLENVFPLVSINRYAFDVELLTLVTMFGYTICEVPVSINGHNNSSVNYREIVRMLLDTLTVFYRKSIVHTYGGAYAHPLAKLEGHTSS